MKEIISKIDLYFDDCDKEFILLWELRILFFVCVFNSRFVVVFFRLI